MLNATSYPSHAFQTLKKKLEEEKYLPGVPFWREGESEEIIKLKEQQKRKFLIEEYLDAALKEEEEYFRSVGFDSGQMSSNNEDTIQAICVGKELPCQEGNKSGRMNISCQSKGVSALQKGENSSLSTPTPILISSTHSLSARPRSAKRKHTSTAKIVEDDNTKGPRRKFNPTRTRRNIKMSRKKMEHSKNISSTLEKISSISHEHQCSSRNHHTGEEVGEKGRNTCQSFSKITAPTAPDLCISLLPESNLHEKKWNAQASQLLQYKKRYGHCNVPQVDPDFGQLGRWLRTQRIAYKGKREGQGGMPTQRIRVLEAIGVKWECKRGKSRR